LKTRLTLVLLFGFLSGFSQEISELVFQNNERTKDSFISKISDVRLGSDLDSLVLEKDILRLQRLPGIAHAYFQVHKNGDGNYKVIYEIEENFTLIPSANIFTTNNDEFAFRLGLYEYNGFGRNIGFGAYYQWDIYSSYSVNFRAPYLFSNKFGLAVNHKNLTTLEPVFLEEGTADYKYNNTSFDGSVMYEISFRHALELGVSYFIEKYEYKSGATNPEVPQNFKVRKFLYKGVYRYRNINYYYQYLDGFKSIFTFQYVISTDSTLPDFIIGWNDFFYYKRVGERGNWASRLRLGVASNRDSPFAPFSVDNNLNIRGVGNTIDRGTASIVLNTEYRYTLYERDWFAFQTNTFIDAGSWRNPGGDFGDFSDTQNIRVYPGIGIRFIHKRIFNAIFRIDYGYGITKDASSGFVFGIGQYF
jgi:outer membrane protein assembly factor BamA